MTTKKTVWLFILVLCYSLSIAQNHSFTYPSPVCTSDPNPAPVTSSNFVSGGHFTSSSGIVFVNAQTGVVNVATSIPGTYTVTYTGAICGCFTNAPVSSTITILGAPSISVAGSASVCVGSAVTLTAVGGSTAYLWSSGANTNTMTSIPVVNTTYTVIGTAANGCTASASKQVTVVALPSITVTANPTVCLGYNYVMSASVTGFATYTWTGPGLNSNSPTVTTNPTVSATYTVVASANGCTNSAVNNVSVIPTPSLIILGSNTVCAGSRSMLYVQGAVNYTWSTGSHADSTAIQPTQSTTYTVAGSDFNGCASTASIFVTVFSNPTVAISGPSVVCSGKTIVLTAFGASSYTWNSGAQTQNVTLSALSDTIVRVTGMSTQGCSSTASLLVGVSPSPSITVNSTSVCAGKQATLIATPVSTQTDAVSYLWSPGGASGATFTPSPAFTTQYTVTASIGSCISREVSNVQVSPAITPTLTFSYTAPYCTANAPYSPVLGKNFATGGTFASSNGALNVNAQTGVVNLASAEPGFYTIQYSVAAQGCTLGGMSNTFMQVFKTVNITMPESIEAQYGDVIILNNSGGANSYYWTPPTGLNCTSCQAPALTVTQDMLYCVSSTQACVVGSCIQVDLICIRTGDFSVPTAFTPNGDGKNDKYCLMGWGECNNSFNVKIFDRWGQMVFESNNSNFCWDGTLDGNPLPSGVYVYRIDAQFSKDPSMTKSGNITLIR